MTLEVSSPDDKAYDDIVWDGLIHSYRPAPDWKTRVSPRLRLAADAVDEIDGIGPNRKRALLRHFGTAKAVGRASVSDLLAVPGISEQMAQAIYDHFHEGG